MKLLILFLFFSISCFSQTADTTQIKDTLKPHSPKKAAFFSMILPGAGQVYNHMAMPKGKKKALWKVPLIYATLGTSAFLLISNQTKATRFKKEYKNRLDSTATDLGLAQYNNEAILSQFYTYQSRRDLFILSTVIIYGVQILDAFVEAHFTEFDVSKDLSLKITPNFIPSLTTSSYSGVKLTLKFK